jgi:hypothetical protein
LDCQKGGEEKLILSANISREPSQELRNKPEAIWRKQKHETTKDSSSAAAQEKRKGEKPELRRPHRLQPVAEVLDRLEKGDTCKQQQQQQLPFEVPKRIRDLDF